MSEEFDKKFKEDVRKQRIDRAKSKALRRASKKKTAAEFKAHPDRIAGLDFPQFNR